MNYLRLKNERKPRRKKKNMNEKEVLRRLYTKRLDLRSLSVPLARFSRRHCSHNLQEWHNNLGRLGFR
jgi:hypothetical protein